MDIDAFNTLSRPGSPNTFLIAPEGLCAKAVPDKVSETFAADPEKLFNSIKDMIDYDGGWSLRQSDAVAGTLSFVVTSRLMRYKDDVDVLVLPAPDGESGSQLAIYSRSRVGYSDMGANRKRVLGLLERLKDRQKPV